jgi:hypothetical protein
MLISCGGGMKDVQKVLRNEKVTSTDEFLVKKKDPLMMPPDYKNLPEPETIINEDAGKERKIKEILKAPREESISTKKSSSIEESIINRIRK